MSDLAMDPKRSRKTPSLRRVKESIEINDIVDIGVKFRTWGLFDVFPEKRHILVEPVEDFNEEIAKTYADIPHVLLNVACSNYDGTGNLFCRGQNGVNNSYLAAEKKNESDQERVATVKTVDTICRENDVREHSLLKIHVGGNEAEVIEGIRDSASLFDIMVLQCPMHQAIKLLKMTEDYGFVLWDMVDLTYIHGQLVQFDAILIHKNLQNDPALNVWKSGVAINHATDVKTIGG